MDDEEQYRKQYQYASEEELEGVKKRLGAGSLLGQIANQILRERRRELSRSARIIAWATIVTAAATVAAALAAWTAIYFQYGQTHTAGNQAVSVAPTPSPSPQ
jgi:hypothetical protein